MLKDLVIQCGLSPSNYSFHGLGRGSATVALIFGCLDSDICMIGGWASSCYRGYICPQSILFIGFHKILVNFARGALKVSEVVRMVVTDQSLLNLLMIFVQLSALFTCRYMYQQW